MTCGRPGLFVVVTALWSCGSSSGASPFARVDAGDAAPYDADLVIDAGGRTGPDRSILGQPCLDDAQCADGIMCTSSRCDLTVGRCRFTPDDARCDDGVFCNGPERCSPTLGCQPGSAIDCNDDNTCTIDACVEATRSCTHVLRDADGDGVPDGHCVVGGDCDDNDPNVYPGHPEVCHNHKDDNCNGLVDEMPCVAPAHDTCLDPLEVKASGTYVLDTTGAVFDYSGTCVPMGANRRDVVAAIELGPGGPRDVDIVALAPSGALSLGFGSECGNPSAEITCGVGLDAAKGGMVARIRGRSLAPGGYPLYVWADQDEQIVLHIEITDPTSKPTNETCATAVPVALGTPTHLSIVDPTKDLATRCTAATGELVFSFVLDAPRDVVADATSLDGYGNPSISLRSPSCAMQSDEIACNAGADAQVFARALPAGTYYLSVAASAPTEIQLTVNASPPSAPPPDESCVGAPLLEPARTLDVSLTGHAENVAFSCSPQGAPDAAYDLELTGPSDVLLVERISSGATGSVALSLPACGPTDALGCSSGTVSPVRASVRGVGPGSYRAVVHSQAALPVELTAWVRASIAPTLVAFSDMCASAMSVGPEGGFFQGNTANANSSYPSGCDVIEQARAPSQMLKLVLAERKRVILDMQGSRYATLLDVRRADSCPGTEVPGACTIGVDPERSFLDLKLDAGEYWIQISGYAGDAGSWFLDVRVGDP